MIENTISLGKAQVSFTKETLTEAEISKKMPGKTKTQTLMPQQTKQCNNSLISTRICNTQLQNSLTAVLLSPKE